MNKFIIGLILGIGIAAGIAYYLNNMPNQFVAKFNNSTSNITASAPVVLAPGTKLKEASGNITNDASSPKYDFYNVLQGEKATNSDNSSNETAPKNYFVEAGSFTDSNLANDMKARITLLGFDAIVNAKQEDNNLVNQILIGPYKSESEAKSVLQQLKQNKIDATIITNN